jgi:hypothetical protein
MSLVSDPVLFSTRKDNPAVFRLLCEFNYLPAVYLHTSRRPDFFDNKLPDKVWNCSRVWPRLSALILRQLDLQEDIQFSLPTQQHSFVLLSPVRLARLAQHIGAILLGSQIRSSLARDEVLRWRERLGQEAFDFAMNRARLLPSAHLAHDSKGATDVAIIGFGVLIRCLSDLPKGISQRALLKMPADSVAADIDAKHAKQLVQSVMLTLEGEWRSLFLPKTI